MRAMRGPTGRLNRGNATGRPEINPNGLRGVSRVVSVPLHTTVPSAVPTTIRGH